MLKDAIAVAGEVLTEATKEFSVLCVGKTVDIEKVNRYHIKINIATERK